MHPRSPRSTHLTLPFTTYVESYKNSTRAHICVYLTYQLALTYLVIVTPTKGGVDWWLM